MGIQEDRTTLRKSIQELKSRFDRVDLTTVKKPEEIEIYLSHIDDVYIQVQQFKSIHHVNDWINWGHTLWSDIERNKAALERNLNRIEREKAKETRNSDRLMSMFSLLLVVIVTISAAVSAYYAYRSFDKTKAEERMAKEKMHSDSKQVPLIKQIQPTR